MPRGPTLTLVFETHATTVDNEAGLASGWFDVALSTVERVSEWLGEVIQQSDAGTVLIIGHRATFYALEHLLNGVPLREAVKSPWLWQPGWTYDLHPDSDHTSS